MLRDDLKTEFDALLPGHATEAGTSRHRAEGGAGRGLRRHSPADHGADGDQDPPPKPA